MKAVDLILTQTLIMTIMLLSGMPSPVSSQEAGTIRINEVLASNNTSQIDPDFSQYADWVELYFIILLFSQDLSAQKSTFSLRRCIERAQKEYYAEYGCPISKET